MTYSVREGAEMPKVISYELQRISRFKVLIFLKIYAILLVT